MTDNQTLVLTCLSRWPKLGSFLLSQQVSALVDAGLEDFVKEILPKKTTTESSAVAPVKEVYKTKPLLPAKINAIARKLRQQEGKEAKSSPEFIAFIESTRTKYAVQAQYLLHIGEIRPNQTVEFYSDAAMTKKVATIEPSERSTELKYEAGDEEKNEDEVLWCKVKVRRDNIRYFTDMNSGQSYYRNKDSSVGNWAGIFHKNGHPESNGAWVDTSVLNPDYAPVAPLDGMKYHILVNGKKLIITMKNKLIGLGTSQHEEEATKFICKHIRVGKGKDYMEFIVAEGKYSDYLLDKYHQNKPTGQDRVKIHRRLDNIFPENPAQRWQAQAVEGGFRLFPHCSPGMFLTIGDDGMTLCDNVGAVITFVTV